MSDRPFSSFRLAAASLLLFFREKLQLHFAKSDLITTEGYNGYIIVAKWLYVAGKHPTPNPPVRCEQCRKLQSDETPGRSNQKRRWCPHPASITSTLEKQQLGTEEVLKWSAATFLWSKDRSLPNEHVKLLEVRGHGSILRSVSV